MHRSFQTFFGKKLAGWRRDVKRAHEDAAALIDPGLIEKDAGAALICPFENTDMVMARKAA